MKEAEYSHEQRFARTQRVSFLKAKSETDRRGKIISKKLDKINVFA